MLNEGSIAYGNKMSSKKGDLLGEVRRRDDFEHFVGARYTSTTCQISTGTRSCRRCSGVAAAKWNSSTPWVDRAQS